MGLLVKIRDCSREEAESIFESAGIHFNSSMVPFLGTGGVIKEAYEEKCDVQTPDAKLNLCCFIHKAGALGSRLLS